MSSENTVYGFVPILSSQEGSCLSMANWEEAGVRAVSYRLEDLLMKPGQEMLAGLDGIRRYAPWPGLIILNASQLKPNREGVFRFRSVYDGAWIRLDIPALFQLIVQLKPDRIILPEGSAAWNQTVWKNLPASIVPYWHASDSLSAGEEDAAAGFAARVWPDAALIQDKIDTEDKAVYIQADITDPMALRPHTFLESDSPARAGAAGLVYSQDGTFSVLDPAMEQAFQLLDRDCTCPTCKQQFTRAYLHHLLQHTPLLAQRFIVQHNASFVQQRLNPSPGMKN
ncbi:queuine tRNA-ribosyltransferase [Legionella sp. CNM-4043-24]|uniref:queuine tRNA-ribosyltransferase n=1 Tax=Legionella sp. CNM-4043-24 TaxID=3421646 RepID=UPI00403AD74C